MVRQCQHEEITAWIKNRLLIGTFLRLKDSRDARIYILFLLFQMTGNKVEGSGKPETPDDKQWEKERAPRLYCFRPRKRRKVPMDIVTENGNKTDVRCEWGKAPQTLKVFRAIRQLTFPITGLIRSDSFDIPLSS